MADAGELRRFLAPPEEGLHDPRLLPDAAAALARVKLARDRNERALVYGDFDADGLTGLSIAVIALRLFGIDAEPYVPERVGDGHGLSLRAIDRAVAENRTLIVTADCGTSSSAEIDLAVSRGVDVIVTDHHHAPTWPAGAVAVVNPQRTNSAYPEKGLTGAGADTSCMTCASDTFSARMAMPASAEATRIAVSTIVSRSASWPVGGSYAPSP